MKNDYLWDRSGEPDPELQKLEASLGRFRAEPRELDLSRAPAETMSGRGFGWRIPRFAAASLVAVGCAAVLALLLLPFSPTVREPGWEVERLAGAPQVGRTALPSGGKAHLKVGELLVTDNSSRAALSVAEIGEVYVDPGSRVRMLETGANRKRLAVELGTIHAAIWAPPGEFVVDTPSATAVDLGCAYTLTVEEDGSGTLHTTLGWVGFHQGGHDSFIPAGAMCRTRPKEGPGTPFFEDASERLRATLEALDFGQLPREARRAALHTVIAEARERDAFTLWHLLARVGDDERGPVLDRLVALVPMPSGVTRQGTLRLDPGMLDRWWNAFDLGDITIWRFWEQNEPPREKKAAR